MRRAPPSRTVMGPLRLPFSRRFTGSRPSSRRPDWLRSTKAVRPSRLPISKRMGHQTSRRSSSPAVPTWSTRAWA